MFNMTTEATECLCHPGLITHYHEETDRCYELDKKGPCQQGKVFRYESQLDRPKCQCISGYLEYKKTGQCYRAYTRGPCGKRYFIGPIQEGSEVGECVRNDCKHGELFDPLSGKCYPVGRRGPCAKGKLWVFERANSVQGSCHCDPHLIGFWEPHGVCYELGAKGPCPKRRVLSYERKSGKLRCRCDVRRGFVPWANGRCIKAGVRRDKLIPIAGPIEVRGNLIPTERIHRGLTLPEIGIEKRNISHPIKRKPNSIPPKLQRDILSDILQTIQNVTLTQSRSSTSIRAEVSEQVSPVITIHVNRPPLKKISRGRKVEAISLTTSTVEPEDPSADSSQENHIFSDNTTTESSVDKEGPPRRRAIFNYRNGRRMINLARKRNSRPLATTPATPTTASTMMPQPSSYRRFRKRMMGRKDIPELILRQKGRRRRTR